MADHASMEEIVRLSKNRGFIFPGSEIYGGLANSWDYGPLGVELKNNVKRSWWEFFVQRRLDVVGVDGAIIMNPKVWEASGHITTFHDPLVECKNCHSRFRADEINTTAACPQCGTSGEFTDPSQFNLMFKTHLGPTEDAGSVVYLRPETAQTMFVDFPAVVRSSRKRIPFGIAQIGRAFRNEITPGNFIFRTREFEQMEIEYFVHSENWQEHFEEWLGLMHQWLESCGIDGKRVHDVEVAENERAHYSRRTIDIEFEFPFGQKELYGLAYRGDYDLRQHADHAGQDMSYADPQTNEIYIPHVIEPSFGVDRTVLAMLLSAYTEEEAPTADGGTDKRVVMKFPPRLAPYQVAVLPLLRKPELVKVAKPLAQQLSNVVHCEYDETQSIGRRYRRQDEIGTPWCVTVDFDTLEDKAVTIRDRDSMEQERIVIEEVADKIQSKLESLS